jgi:acetyl-CoA carboxylase biotin carboxyl carrier protein
MGLTYKEVTDILRVIDATDAHEVVVEIDGTRIVVRRDGTGSMGHARQEPAPAGPAAAVGTAAAVAPRPARDTTVGLPPAPPGGVTVSAPMVGTFYRRPSPEQPPFVEVGQTVAKGDPLCLIEVMKLFTTVEAPVAGRVVTIGAEDGALVEYEQMLLVIVP